MKRRDHEIAFVMGGGKGERLMPLTADRAKPAVPFGGSYRIIDFVLSNAYHSGLDTVVLTQYKPDSLDRHLKVGWHPLYLEEGGRLETRHSSNTDEGFYHGTADAVYQNLGDVREGTRVIGVYGADHIYRMNMGTFHDDHLQSEADLTISALPVSLDKARGKLGVLVVDNDGWVVDFQEKPQEPTPIPGSPTLCYASMGNYAFNPKVLIHELGKDAVKAPGTTWHDFGKDIIPTMLREGKRIRAYNFQNNTWPGSTPVMQGYWRDVGTIQEYFDANMDLAQPLPEFSLYIEEWPIMTAELCHADPKITDRSMNGNMLLAKGVIVGGRTSDIDGAILSYNSRIWDSHLENVVVLGNVDLRGVRLRRAIVDKGVQLAPGTEIGYDLDFDRKRGLTVTDEGIVVVPRKYRI